MGPSGSLRSAFHHIIGTIGTRTRTPGVAYHFDLQYLGVKGQYSVPWLSSWLRYRVECLHGVEVLCTVFAPQRVISRPCAGAGDSWDVDWSLLTGTDGI